MPSVNHTITTPLINQLIQQLEETLGYIENL